MVSQGAPPGRLGYPFKPAAFTCISQMTLRIIANTCCIKTSVRRAGLHYGGSMTKLQQYFPMIRTKDQILEDINSNPDLKAVFESWPEFSRELFVQCCTGIRGQKILYDAFFKRIFDPEQYPERMIAFLSLLLGRKVISVKTIKNESPLVMDDASLMVFDITVVLEDGSMVNVEIQKYGYKFPGQRAACYSADLVLRQYQAMRKNDPDVAYNRLCSTYTIILMEGSPAVFHQHPDVYIHHFIQRSDTGLELPLLQEYLFIPLDIFSKCVQDKSISSRSELEAWFTFLVAEKPEEIVELIEAFPFFKPIYEQIYQICRNMEGYMPLFAEQLRNLDRNTMRLMYDELKEENDGLKEENVGLKEKMTDLRNSFAKRMLENENSTQDIVRMTSLSEDEIRKIAEEIGIPMKP